MTRASCLTAVTFAAFGLAALPQTLYAQQAHLDLTTGDVVTVSGVGTVGTIGGLPVANSTNLYTTGENPPGYDIGIFGGATFTLADGGTLGVSSNGLYFLGSGTVAVTGGTIDVQNGSVGVYCDGTGTVNVSGGTIRGRNPLVAQTGTINFTGGTLTPGNGYGLVVSGSGSGGSGIGGFGGFNPPGVIDVFGTGFSYTPSGGTATAITSGTVTGTYGTLKGTLLNGQPLSTTYNNQGGYIRVNVGPAPSPEPSPFAAFAVGLLGLSALALKARKRQAA